MIGTLHPDEVEEVLHRNRVGRLACVAAGRPYVVPITYVYAGGAVYGRTLPGRKVAALRAEPRVCFEVDERDGVAWRSVVAEGVYEELTDAAERQAVHRLLHGLAPAALPAAVPGVLFRLRLSEKTGRYVRREAPTLPVDGASPLLGLDLRAGDTWNYPRRPGA
jgi:nitroimidazol reductase NimA-like FMN-containing flavoprotein (pyridoxamine 5'-phosphate oxidase superfamily)